jgi:ATP-dependent RNA helicase DDX35
VIFALEQLFSLGAMDLDGKLTARGLQMAELPVEPRWARCLLASRSPNFDVQEEMLSIAAICTLESPFLFPFNAPPSTMGGSTASKEDRERKMRARDAFVVPGSDHATLLNVFQQYREEIVQRRGSDSAAHAWCEEHGVLVRIMKRAEDVRRGLVLALRRLPALDEGLRTAHHGDPTNVGNNSTFKRVRRCLLTGFFANCARLTPDGRYRTIRGGVPLLPLPTTSVLASFGAPPEWIVFGEVSSASLTQNSSQSLSQSSAERVWVRDASSIEPLWLTELAPHYYDLKF